MPQRRSLRSANNPSWEVLRLFDATSAAGTANVTAQNQILIKQKAIAAIQLLDVKITCG